MKLNLVQIAKQCWTAGA